MATSHDGNVQPPQLEGLMLLNTSCWKLGIQMGHWPDLPGYSYEMICFKMLF